jgi:predicted RecB family nuclease
MIHISMLENHLQCETKSYLRFHGRSGQATEYAMLCEHLDARHRANAFQWLAAQSTTAGVRHFDGSRLEDLATGHAMILDAVGGADGLETHFHGLQRLPGDSRLGPYTYRPIRVSRYLQPTSALRLLLAFDALVLGRLQGLLPDGGVLICGPMFRRIRVRLPTHLESLTIILTRLRRQIASVNEPLLTLNRHCELCEFKQHCRAKAVEAGNLTLLRGMTSKEMARHNSKGIFTVNQLSYTFRAKRPAKRQKQRFPHSFALQALALRENTVHVHGDPSLALSPTQVYLDIEGLPDRGFYYLIGALVVTGQSSECHSFWADDESQQVTIFAQLAELLTATSGGKVFYYGNYDINAVRRMLSRMPEPSEKALRAILTSGTNILSIARSQVYFPTTSNSLKEVAAFLGFRWTNVEASGLDSIVWREQWEDTRDEALKTKLLQYNREDCLALRAVAEFMASITRREVLGLPERSRADKIVYTGELLSAMSRKHKFGKAEFCLPDFEFVNRCSYFDYQRDRAYLRSKKKLGVTKPRPTPKRPRRAKINKRIEVSLKRCPFCNSRRISKGRALSTCTIDMKFSGGGVRKWVTAYSGCQYHCDKCGKTFSPPAYPHTASLYGDDLVNWTIYQNVALGQNMLKVERCLGEVFKLNIPQSTLQRFKARAAKRYESTKEAILAELLRGPSLNVDETEARLRKEKANVWVYAGVNGTYYEYRDSRNGQFLTERLKGFGGVLVSDFFTAYDSIACPQQKCVIHLIRDMNEDVKANPFDTELKGIVEAFASIMRPIIETVDRYGLTKSRLQKHKTAAMGFVEKVVARRVSTEAATKYQNRIEKYGHRLFTFLDFDGVPWNNNNAEHAIKAFARYRRFADGRFTKTSLSNYLVILSVFQTCDYRGRKVLDFLRSGETDFAFPNVAGAFSDNMRGAGREFDELDEPSEAVRAIASRC